MRSYLDIVENVLSVGRQKENRTGIKSYTTFCEIFRHNMSDGFPLLTTKKMPYRMIYGSIAMAKRYFTQPNEYHYGSSLFYVISEETFFKYLRDPPNY